VYLVKASGDWFTQQVWGNIRNISRSIAFCLSYILHCQISVTVVTYVVEAVICVKESYMHIRSRQLLYANHIVWQNDFYHLYRNCGKSRNVMELTSCLGNAGIFEGSCLFLLYCRYHMLIGFCFVLIVNIIVEYAPTVLQCIGSTDSYLHATSNCNMVMRATRVALVLENFTLPVIWIKASVDWTVVTRGSSGMSLIICSLDRISLHSCHRMELSTPRKQHNSISFNMKMYNTK